MIRHLKLFDKHSEYVAFTDTEDFVLPNVSFCKDKTDEVHYNPYEGRISPNFYISLEHDGFDVIIEIRGPEDILETTLTAYLDGVVYSEEVYLTEGRTDITIPGVIPGSHEIRFNFPGDSKYLPEDVREDFQVSKGDYPFSMSLDDMEQGQDAVISITGPDEYSLDTPCVLYINDTLLSDELRFLRGKITYTIDSSKYQIGENTVRFVFPGNAYYLSNEISDIFTVSQA